MAGAPRFPATWPGRSKKQLPNNMGTHFPLYLNNAHSLYIAVFRHDGIYQLSIEVFLFGRRLANNVSTEGKRGFECVTGFSHRQTQTIRTKAIGRDPLIIAGDNGGGSRPSRQLPLPTSRENDTTNSLFMLVAFWLG